MRSWLRKGLLLGLLVLFCGCFSVERSSSMLKCTSLKGYRYIYMSPSGMDAVKSQEKDFDGKETAAVHPYDLVAETLVRSGFVKLKGLEPEKKRQTLIVKYGESPNSGVLGHNTEITLQLIDAVTNETVASATSSGVGTSRAAVVRDAIDRAFKILFEN